MSELAPTFLSPSTVSSGARAVDRPRPSRVYRVGAEKNSAVQVLKRTAAIALLLALWQILPAQGVIDPFLLPPLSSVLRAIARMAATGELARHVFASFLRSATGFLLALGIGLPLGFLMGQYRGFERFVDPLIQAARSTSTLALYPVFILFFGLGEGSKVSIIVWGTLWPVLLNTIGGVRSVDPLLIKLGRSMHLSTRSLLLHVTLPSAFPSILTGVRLGAASSLLMLVAAEMLGADTGLGFMIFYYQERYAIPEMFAGILVISLLGLLLNWALVTLQRRLTRWRVQPSSR